MAAQQAELLPTSTSTSTSTSDLLRAAMRACDHWKDGEQAREQMRLDCLGTPLHQRADLLDHFRSAYPRGPRHERT